MELKKGLTFQRLRNVFLVSVMCLAVVTPADSESAFDAWRLQTLGQFQSYKEARDQAFADMLAQRWTVIQTAKGLVRDAKPKPSVIPAAPKIPDTEIIIDQPGPIDIPPVSDIPMPDTNPDFVKNPEIDPTLSAEPTAPFSKLKFKFYGNSLDFKVVDTVKFDLPRKMNSKSIASGWEALGKSDYENIVEDLQEYALHLQLGDWAKVKLVQQFSINFAQQVSKLNQNEQTFLVWFLLSKLDFDTRLAYQNNQLYLFMSSHHTLYETRFMTLNDQKYYFIAGADQSSVPQNFYTYKSDYDNARESLDLSFDQIGLFAEQITIRTLDFTWQKSKISLDIPVDKTRIEFFNSYPQVDLSLYFHATLGKQSKQQLLIQLAPLLAGKNEKEAANMLLNLVQTSLNYATDGQQFGEENYLLPDETLFYPASDCEDKAVLFAWLIKELLGLEVIGLNYPGHVATAIAFNGDVLGDAVVYGGKTYTLADPTYVNARVGMTMPAFKGVTAKIMSNSIPG